MRLSSSSSPPTGEPLMLPDHEYHQLAVVDVVDETADTRSFVLDIPPALEQTFAYAAGQFCTFRATIDGEPVVRCYSMSSSPDTGDPFTTTVKRVPGGRMSNWMNDTLVAGRDHRGDAPDRALRAARARRSDRRLRRRQRHHAGDLHRQERARDHDAPDRARVREPECRLGHLRRRARAVALGRPATGSRSTITSTPNAASSIPRSAPRWCGSTRTPTSTSAVPARTWTPSKPACRCSASRRRSVFIERFVRSRGRARRPGRLHSRLARDPARPPEAHRRLSRRRHGARGRAARRLAPAVLVRGGQLRDLHGAPRRGIGHDAREQRVVGGRARRRAGC